MTAGNLDQLITLQRAVETSDGIGGTTRAWADLVDDPTVWAGVKAKSGREGMAEGRINAVYVVVFTIRNRSDLSEVDRIVWNGEAYNIRGIMREGERGLYLRIEAERGAAQ